MKEYLRWKELTGLNENMPDYDEDSFADELKFGTAGLRGIDGIGTNRINEFVIARAAQALSLKIKNSSNHTVGISYDSRKNSKKYAQLSAEIFAENGITVYIAEELMPTPCLAFVLKKYKLGGGIMVTASHNPRDYSGYKVYGDDGCQISGEYADDILQIMKGLDYFGIKKLNFENAKQKGLIKLIDENQVQEYLQCLKSYSYESCSGLKLCYTPLNGAGYKIAPKVLRDSGAEVFEVLTQNYPDPNFTTCPYPNPEKAEAFNEALKVARENSCDIILANDPDADRIGIMYLCNDKYVLLSGDEIGLIVADFLLKFMSDIKGSYIVRTVVTMSLCDRIAKSKGASIIESFTGFKNICAEAVKLVESGQEDKFIMGYEESNGLCVGTYAFDKDGIMAAYILAQYTSSLKQIGKTFKDALEEIYLNHGFMTSSLVSFKLTGELGKKNIKKIMSYFHKLGDSLKTGDILSDGLYVEGVRDYLKGVNGMPKADVIIFDLKNDGRIALRPSGTEPLLKIYLQTTDKTKSELKLMESFIKATAEKIIN